MKTRDHNGIHYQVIRVGRSFIPGISNLYRMVSSYTIKTPVTGYYARTEYIALELDGWMGILGGYEWDGPSGPTIDTKSFMRASLVHDAFYELLREEQVPFFVKASADMLMRRIAICDGMSHLRATYAYKAVKTAADFAAMPRGEI